MSRYGEPPGAPVAGNGTVSRAGNGGIRIVITGKGGVGKTTITALLAHLLHRRGSGYLPLTATPSRISR